MPPLHCPYTTPICSLEPRYDTTAPSDTAVAAIVENVQDEDVIQTILEAVTTRIYRGESCQRCGAWFPADQLKEQ